MKMALIGILIFYGMAVAGESPKTSGDRVSADGTKYPDAIQDRAFNERLPIVGTSLGSLPEEVKARILSAEKNAKQLKTGIGLENYDWFAPQAFGGIAAGFELTDGRVTKIDIKFTALSHEKAASFREQFKKQPDGIEVSIGESTASLPGRLCIEIKPVHWYLLNHAVDPTVADAMKNGTLAVGMTSDEAILVLGKPTSVTKSDLEETMTWVFRTFVSGGFNGAGPVVGSRRPSRVASATFLKGKAISVSDGR